MRTNYGICVGNPKARLNLSFQRTDPNLFVVQDIHIYLVYYPKAKLRLFFPQLFFFFFVSDYSCQLVY
jgi:hypothetical protein